MSTSKLEPAPQATALPLEAASEDLAALAWLHESERDVSTLGRLHAGGFPDGLTLARPGMPAVTDMEQALAVIRDWLRRSILPAAACSAAGRPTKPSSSSRRTGTTTLRARWRTTRRSWW